MCRLLFPPNPIPDNHPRHAPPLPIQPTRIAGRHDAVGAERTPPAQPVGHRAHCGAEPRHAPLYPSVLGTAFGHCRQPAIPPAGRFGVATDARGETRRAGNEPVRQRNHAMAAVAAVPIARIHAGRYVCLRARRAGRLPEKRRPIALPFGRTDCRCIRPISGVPPRLD